MDLNIFAEQCNNALFDGSEKSDMALNYLMGSRGLNETTIREFTVGYCSSYQDLPGGTIKEQKANKGLLGKITVPIRSEFGEVMALAGRYPLTASKGWFNQIFEKSSHLFLFDKARKYAYEHNKIYLAEGYLDGMIPWQYGLHNISCIMGTHLGYRRVGLISRYCDSVCLCFDTDVNQSGQRAQRRSIAELAILGIEGISKIELPMGDDPDDFVRKNGVQEFLDREVLIKKADIKLAVREYQEERSRGGRNRNRG